VVIDADVVARKVLEPGEPALDEVIARFGSDLLLGDGSLDRAALGRVVFADPAALRDLEAIVHPVVRPRILATMDGAAQSIAQDPFNIDGLYTRREPYPNVQLLRLDVGERAHQSLKNSGYYDRWSESNLRGVSLRPDQTLMPQMSSLSSSWPAAGHRPER
jgi:hypothetical protein